MQDAVRWVKIVKECNVAPNGWIAIDAGEYVVPSVCVPRAEGSVEAKTGNVIEQGEQPINLALIFGGGEAVCCMLDWVLKFTPFNRQEGRLDIVAAKPLPDPE